MNMTAIFAALQAHLSVEHMKIQERSSLVGGEDAVLRVHITFTADKSFLQHASVRLVRQVNDGPWQKSLHGIGDFEVIVVPVESL